jgi:hypothetical protein
LPNKNIFKRNQTNSLAANDNLWQKMSNINLEDMYGQEKHAAQADKNTNAANNAGFNTDRVVYQHNQLTTTNNNQESSDA